MRLYSEVNFQRKFSINLAGVEARLFLIFCFFSSSDRVCVCVWERGCYIFSRVGAKVFISKRGWRRRRQRAKMSNELKNFKSALLGALPFPVGRPRRCRRQCCPYPPPHSLKPHSTSGCCCLPLALKSSLCQVITAVYNRTQVVA